MTNYDTWKATEPDDRYPSAPVKYVCRDCAWRGDGIQAAHHHHKDHHRIVLPNGREVMFSCCAGGSVRRTA